MGQFDESVNATVYLWPADLDREVCANKEHEPFIEIPQVFETMTSFCASIKMMLNTMALAMTRVSPRPETWQPVTGGAPPSAPTSFALHGDRFAIGQTEDIGSIDELLDLLR